MVVGQRIFEKIALDHLDASAFGLAREATARHSAGSRQLKQGAIKSSIAPQDSDQKRARSACHIEHSAVSREIIARCECRRRGR